MLMPSDERGEAPPRWGGPPPPRGPSPPPPLSSGTAKKETFFRFSGIIPQHSNPTTI